MRKRNNMRALCDANVLLALVYRQHSHHTRVLSWLGTMGDNSVAVCRFTQNALLRLLSQPVVMGEDVCTLRAAWQVYDEMMRDARFAFCDEPDGVESLWRGYSAEATVAPRLWTDAYLAAFASASGMQLVTFDRAFRQYRGLDVILLGPAAVHEAAAGYGLP